MTNFVQYILNYRSTINYDKAHNEAVHKYFLKAFYEKINKKKWKLQILKHNICYINVIAMQDFILIVKIPVKSTKKKKFVVDMPLCKCYIDI